jgi:hypothetical protein
LGIIGVGPIHKSQSNSAGTGGGSIANLKECLEIPADFRQKVRSAMHPGTTMVITSKPVANGDRRSRNVTSGQ